MAQHPKILAAQPDNNDTSSIPESRMVEENHFSQIVL